MKILGCIVLGILGILAIVAAVIFGPLLLLWSIGMLFNVQNPYDFTHWFAAAVLIALLAGSSQSKISRNK